MSFTDSGRSLYFFIFLAIVFSEFFFMVYFSYILKLYKQSQKSSMFTDQTF